MKERMAEGKRRRVKALWPTPVGRKVLVRDTTAAMGCAGVGRMLEPQGEMPMFRPLAERKYGEEPCTIAFTSFCRVISRPSPSDAASAAVEQRGAWKQWRQRPEERQGSGFTSFQVVTGRFG